MKRHLPPAGLPLAAAQVWGSLAGVASPGGERRRLAGELAALLPEGSAVHLRSSGRDALYQLLRACASIRPERTEVVMAGYTCWSVPAAAIRAGLTVRLVDIDPSTLDFDEPSLAAVPGDRALAVVSHHLLGYPNRMDLLGAAAERWGAFLIDDAAQGFGASLHGRPVGAFGDAAVLSFGRGKGIPALGGGAAVVHPCGQELAPLLDALSEEGRPGAARFAQAVAHQVFFPPERYHIPAGMPFLGLGRTDFDTAFLLGPMEGYAASLARRLLVERARLSRARREAASRYDSLLGGHPRIRTIDPVQGGEPSYLRYGALLPGGLSGIDRAEASRLGISSLYPAAVADIPALPAGSLAGGGDLPGSREAARSLVTLPTHPSVTDEDGHRIARFLEGAP